MRALSCPACEQLLGFDARSCPGCGRGVGFDPAAGRFRARGDDGRWHGRDGEADGGLRPCANARLGVCNWLHAGRGGALCAGCRFNRVIPDLAMPGVFERWALIEGAKKRTLHTLIRLGAPPLAMGEGGFGLSFDVLYDPAAEGGAAPDLLTGHSAGVVTINLIEADDVARERFRREFGEPYRTLVGHFRHEIGHYYWHRLIEFTPDLWPFRALFGDERADYAAALAAHYAGARRADWEADFVSAYATMHPWEDFAETFAHYLHIVDTLATIASFDMTVGAVPAAGGAGARVDFDPFVADTATLIDAWIPLAFAVNAVNRSMGQPDLYPFRITPAIVLKLDFVNRLLAFAAGRWSPGEAEGAGLKAMIATLGHGIELGD